SIWGSCRQSSGLTPQFIAGTRRSAEALRYPESLRGPESHAGPPTGVCRSCSFAPSGLVRFPLCTHGLRPFGKLRASCGLHSSAASRLNPAALVHRPHLLFTYDTDSTQSQLHVSQAEGVGDYGDGAEAHGGGGEDRT